MAESDYSSPVTVSWAAAAQRSSRMPPEHHFSQPQHPGPDVGPSPNCLQLSHFPPTYPPAARAAGLEKSFNGASRDSWFCIRVWATLREGHRGNNPFMPSPTSSAAGRALPRHYPPQKHNHCCLCNNPIPKVPTGIMCKDVNRCLSRG